MNSSANPAYLIFLRMATGLILGLSFIALWPDFKLFYSPSGMVDHELLGLMQGRPRLSVYDMMNYLQQQWQWDFPAIQTGLLIGYLCLCTLLVCGLLTRITAFLLLLLHGTIFTALPQFSYGFDYFCTIALFYCLVFPTNRYGSMDRMLFHLRGSKWVGPCLRVLQLHLCLVYSFSGLEKGLGHTWRNGEALWKALHLPYFNKGSVLDLDWLGAYPWIFVVGGWLVFMTEFLYPVFIWLPRTRKLYLWLIISMHLGIAVLLHLYLFSAMMILLNLAAFYYDLPEKENLRPLGYLENKLKHLLLKPRTKRATNL